MWVCVWGGGKSDAMTVHAALCVWTRVSHWAIPANIYLLLFCSGVGSSLCPAPRCLSPSHSSFPSSRPFLFPFLTLIPLSLFHLHLPTPSSPLSLTLLSSCPSFPADPSPCSGSAGCGIFSHAPWQMWQLLELYHLGTALCGAGKPNVVSQAAGMDRWENSNLRLLLSCGSDFSYLCLWHFVQCSCQQWMRD